MQRVRKLPLNMLVSPRAREEGVNSIISEPKSKLDLLLKILNHMRLKRYGSQGTRKPKAQKVNFC